MKSHRFALVAIVAAVLSLSTGLAQADTKLVYSGSGSGGPYVVWIRAGDIRIDGGGAEWQLYRAQSSAIISVQPDEKSYTRLDKHVARGIRRQMNALRKRMQTRLQQLPIAQRPAARAAMAAKIAGLDPTPEKVGVERTHEHDRIAGVDCQVVQIIRGGKPAHKMCVARTRALGIDKASYKTLQSMFGLLRTMLSGTGLEGVGLPYRHLSGVPIRFVDSISGQRRHLMSISHDKISDSRFQIPENYTRKKRALPAQ